MSELIEVLSKTKHKYVKLGAENGNGFFYAGKVNTLLKDTYKVDKVCHLAAKKAVTKYTNQLDRLCRYYPAPGEYAMTLIKNNAADEISAEHYLKFLDKHFNKIKSTSAALGTAKDMLEHYKCLESRKVIRCEEANDTVDEDCLVIIVEGYERGKYWMLNEAEPGKEIGFDISEDSELCDEVEEPEAAEKKAS